MLDSAKSTIDHPNNPKIKKNNKIDQKTKNNSSSKSAELRLDSYSPSHSQTNDFQPNQTQLISSLLTHSQANDSALDSRNERNSHVTNDSLCSNRELRNSIRSDCEPSQQIRSDREPHNSLRSVCEPSVQVCSNCELSKQTSPDCKPSEETSSNREPSDQTNSNNEINITPSNQESPLTIAIPESEPNRRSPSKSSESNHKPNETGFHRKKRVKMKPLQHTFEFKPDEQLLLSATTTTLTDKLLNLPTFKVHSDVAEPITFTRSDAILKPSPSGPTQSNAVASQQFTIDEFTSHPANGHFLMEIDIPGSDERHMIDTGSMLSLTPPNKTDELRSLGFRLSAANKSPIGTYGYRSETLRIDKLELKWCFVVADVRQPIIGIDFLRQHQILINPYLNQLIHRPTGTLIQCRPTWAQSSCMSIVSENPGEQLLSQFPEITDSIRRPGKSIKIMHHIETVGVPKFPAMYHYNVVVEQAILEFFTELERKGIVRRSQAQFNSPLAVVLKKDGSFRICGDYRNLNAITVNNAYTLPHLHSFNNRFAGSEWFSTIDFKDAYYLLRMHPNSIAKTAVRTPFGSFEFLFMPFGLMCASQTWQQAVDEIFHDFLRFLFIYIDDLVIHSKTLQEHLEHLQLVFARMREYGLKINAKKSQLCKQQVNYIGYEVSSKGVSPNNDKVQALLNVPEPTTFKQLKSFTCALSYYAKFIPGFFKIAKSLTSIKQKTKCKTEPLKLDEKQLADFKQLKTLLANHVKLAHPVAGAPLVIESDASDVGMGAVLYQMVNQELQPLFFFSKAFKDDQKHWDIYRKELEALYQAICRLNKLVLGNTLIIYTDNTVLLKNLVNCKDVVNPVELRKLITISQVMTEAYFIPTNRNVVADYLSRIPVLRQYCSAISLYLGSMINYNLLSAHQMTDEWCKSLKNDSRYKLVFKTHQGKSLPFWTYTTDSGRQLFCAPAKYRKQIFDAYHDPHHPGYKRTAALIASRFYWPSLVEQTKYMTKCCLKCQMNKFSRQQSLPLKSIPTENEKFARLYIDSVGPIPDELTAKHGFRFILTIRDMATRYLVLIPLKTLEKEETYHAFVRRWIGQFGLPKAITTDNHGQFCNHLLDNLLSKLGINHHRTLPYLPRANTIIERPHSQVASSLRSLPCSADWHSALPLIQLFWNNTMIDGSCYTPHQLTFGQAGRLPSDFFEPTTVTTDNLEDAEHILFQAMQRFKPACTTNHGQQTTPFIYKDLNSAKFVWLKDLGRTNKYKPIYRGPFEVLERHETHFVLKDRDSVTKQSITLLKPAFHFDPSKLTDNQSQKQCAAFQH